MNKFSKVNNLSRIGDSAKEVIFLEGFKGQSLENVVEYWINFNKGVTLIEEFITEDEINVLPIIKEINGKIKDIDTLIKKL
jgi:hypothetical protein